MLGTALIENDTYLIILLTRTNRVKCLECSVEQKNFTVPCRIGPYSLALICTEIFCIIPLPATVIRLECQQRGDVFTVGFLSSKQPSLRFFGGRTPQQTLQCFNIRPIFLGLRTRLLALSVHYNALRETVPSFTPKFQTPSSKTITWTISLTQWNLLRKESKDRSNFYFSFLVGSRLLSF